MATVDRPRLRGGDLDAVSALPRRPGPAGAVTAAGIAGPDLDTEDHFSVLVGDHVELVAIETATPSGGSP